MSESASEKSRDHGGKPQQRPSSPFTPAGASWDFQKGSWVDSGSSSHPDVREYVIDIAPGGFPPLDQPSEDGVKPQSGVHRHVDPSTGEVTVKAFESHGDSGLPA